MPSSNAARSLRRTACGYRISGWAAGRRGISFWILGRYPEALADLRWALRLLPADGDGAWSARALTTRALVHLARGVTNQASQDLDRADRMLTASGQVRLFHAGRTDAAASELGYAGFGLRRLAHARLAGRYPDSLATLEASGARLESLLLGPASGCLGDRAVVIVPPGRLHAIPWSMLPSLRDRPVSVAPSATAWLRARRLSPPPPRPPVLVAGPGLAAGAAEVRRLAASYQGATVLGSGTATAGRVLNALDGVPLAHIAAHGTFRADSPLFSSLQLDDGPLTVHDLEGLRRAPYLVILSSCDSAALAPVATDELLGLASALAPRGTAGILASVAPVNDQATTELMLTLHQQLMRGQSLAEAICAARTASDKDPVAAATGWSFIAIGGA